MSNTFTSADLIAREALPILKSNMVFGNLVYKDYSNTFASVGDTIQVRKPNSFTAEEFSGTTSYQEITEAAISVKMDKIATVNTKITAHEMSLSVDDFSKQIVEPAMVAIAEKIDADLAGLYLDTFATAGTAGSTPATVATLLAVRKAMNDLKVPFQNRVMVIDPAAEAALLNLEAFSRVDASGDVSALKEASLGRKFGFDTYMNQNINDHTVGTAYTYSGTITSVTSTEATYTLNLANAATDLTFVAGDCLAVGGNEYVCTEDYTFVATTGAISVYPALKATTNAEAVTIKNSHVANLAFHKNAFGLVSRPLSAPLGGANSSVLNYDGLSIRVTFGYDFSAKSNIIQFDYLYGVKTLYPELAVRLLG